MFNKKSSFVIFTILYIILIWKNNVACCDNSNNHNHDKMSETMIMKHDNITFNETKKYDEINLIDIMNYCNESFRIKNDYLDELNTTGSFPDESDKSPMCFIRCYLENVGILTPELEVNIDRAVDMLWSTSENSVEDCIKEMGDGSPCEKSYNLAKCIMTRALVDGRSKDSI